MQSDKIEMLKHLPADATVARQLVTAELEVVNLKIEKFKADVEALAAQFRNIDVNIKRLRDAREAFMRGDIKKAADLLTDKTIDNELERVLRAKAQLSAEVLANKKKLRHLSKEYQLRATLIDLNQAGLKGSGDSEALWLKSIEVFEDFHNLCQVAYYFERRKKKDHCSEYLERALKYCYSNEIRLSRCYYGLGTCLLKTDKLQARHYLKLSVDVLLRDRTRSGMLLIDIGHALHNLASSYGNNEIFDRIDILKQALRVRELSTEIDVRHNSLVSYTCNFLMGSYCVAGDYEMFEKTFDRSLSALEKFCNSDLGRPYGYLNSATFYGLAMSRPIFQSSGRFDEGRMLGYRERLLKIFPAFEKFILRYQKEDVGSLAKICRDLYKFWPNVDLFVNTESEYLFANGETYYKELIIQHGADDEIHGGLGELLAMYGFSLIMRDEMHSGLEKMREAMEHFNAMSIVDEYYATYRDQAKEFAAVECDCDECLRKGEVGE